MAKLRFKSYIPNQIELFPQRLDVKIAENDPVRIINGVIDRLDLSCFKKLYKSKGRFPFHPRMMLKVIIYAYMNNVYSCRKIEKLLLRDIHFMWLAASQTPDFITINRFRNRVKDEVNTIFTQIVLMLVEKGFVTLDVEYVDGTKIESKANKYTFVWKRTVLVNRNKLIEKIRTLLSQVDECIAQDKSNDGNDGGDLEITAEMLTSLAGELKQSLQPIDKKKATKEEKQEHKQKERQIKEIERHRDKLAECDAHLKVLGERNSYAKTDHDATFMHMKEDAMHNGQTKPGYNLQIGTASQFILDFGLFHNPTDTLTTLPSLDSFLGRYGKHACTVVADSGYGSEENYEGMHERGMEAYVKYNHFHKEHRPRYVVNPFSADGMYYNGQEDYYVCPMGQHLTRLGTHYSKTVSGYVTEKASYRAQRCEGCPLRCRCYKSTAARRVIEVNHKLNAYKRQAASLLTSEQGIKHRGQRCIEPEAVFGQIKNNMAYRRFRHTGKDKAEMDFAFLAIAFNLKKMCAKSA